jgi:thymidylate kinase
MLITFSGLDGAGKSTIIGSIVAALEQQHRPVAVLHMNDNIGIHAAVRRLRDVVLGPRPAGPRSPNDVPSLRRSTLWNKGIRRILYPIDLFIFFCYRTYLERIRRRVLIMDRYFYDRLVDVADRRWWWLLRLYERMTPTPALAVYLDASPEECFQRKGEDSVDYLRRRWQAYHVVIPWVAGLVVVDARDLERAEDELRRMVLAHLAEGAA